MGPGGNCLKLSIVGEQCAANSDLPGGTHVLLLLGRRGRSTSVSDERNVAVACSLARNNIKMQLIINFGWAGFFKILLEICAKVIWPNPDVPNQV